MWNFITIITCTIYLCILLQQCSGLHLIELKDKMYYIDNLKQNQRQRDLTINSVKKYGRKSYNEDEEFIGENKNTEYDEASIKTKMIDLVKKTVFEVEEKLKTIKFIKDKHKNESAYKVGFILSLIKKANEAIQELYNVVVKHKDSWKALHMLKIFDLIFSTNVDLSHLIRQMLEEHVRDRNSKN